MATTHPQPSDFPWESRDKENEAKVSYNLPMRRENQILVNENLKLKRLLRENGIAWSPVAQAHIQKSNPAKRVTRAAKAVQPSAQMKVPMEVLLRILEFAMTSPRPIIDPLSPRNPDHLTDAEKTADNQIAINMLVACRALNVEGQRFLWEKNQFTFTTPEAVSHFAELDSKYRSQIQQVTFRIVASFFDDEKRKYRHKLDALYHPELRTSHTLRTVIRPKESPLSKGGFRSYSWLQVVDFLTALRAPYMPKIREKTPRPRLLPSLVSLRIDFVNFLDILPIPTKELHDVTNHELARTLNELQLTGLPYEDIGARMGASSELIGMVKDDGLYLQSVPRYISLGARKGLKPLSGLSWCARVIRPRLAEGGTIHDEHGPSHIHWDMPGEMPAAPRESGHPESTEEEDERFIYKKVPVSRDSDQREWKRFSCRTGYPWAFEDDYDSDEEDYLDEICPNCGEPHAGSSFLYDEDFDESDWY
ncbi:hypothetical protein LIA77_07465 [Sarocladium implicatum]|nr:hypothetical protein LIA77_07465 [Sarocladium implicatum]